MSTPIDLRPAASRLVEVISSVSADQLGRRTPCEDYTVSRLLEHIHGFGLAFTAAARKERLEAPPPQDGLDPAWRQVL